MKNSIYTEEHQIFRDSFRKFVAKEITPFVSQWEEARAVPRELWLKMGEQGFLLKLRLRHGKALKMF